MKKILILLFLVSLAFSAFAAWTEQAITPSPSELYDIAGSTTATICAVGDSGAVYKTTNYGTTWTSITSATIGATALRGVSIFGNSLWAAGGTKTFVSTDWGAFWTEKIGGALPTTAILGIDFGSANNGVAVGLSGTSAAVSYTSNAGTTWVSSTPGGVGTTLYAAHFIDANTVWIVGNGGDIYKSADGGQNWTQKAAGLTANDLRDVYFVDANNGFIVGSNQTFLYTTDGGENWSKETLGYSSNIGVFALDANTVWIVGQHTVPSNTGKIAKLTKSGSIWSSSEELSVSSEIYNGIYFSDADNGWTVGELPGTPSIGKVYSSITPLAITSVVQKNRPSQAKAPQGFSGDLTIAGNNFQVGPWTPGLVSFSGSGITVNSVTRGSLTVNISVAASAATTSRDITITNIDGTSDTLTSAFAVTALPTITSVYPPALTQGTTSDLAISGTGFQAGIATAEVVFSLPGITVNSLVVNGDNSLSVNVTIASGAAAGTGNITVTNPDGGSATGSSIFSISPFGVTPPSITSLSPGSGEQGQTYNVTISGSNFHANPTVIFGNGGVTVNTVAFNSASSLTANISISAAATTGARTVTVRNTDDSGIGSLANAFRVKAPGTLDPNIISITPGFGYAGGTKFFLTGEAFQDGATVSFTPSASATSIAPFSTDNIVVNSVEFVSATSLRIDATISSTTATGLWNVNVINPDGGGDTLGGGFEVMALAPTGQIVDGQILANPNPYRGTGQLKIQWVSSGPDVVEIKCYTPDGFQLLTNPPTITVTPGYNTVAFNRPDFWQFDNGMKLFLIKSTTQNIIAGKVKVMVVNTP
ncbi:MAG: IPT/TIG domain-containing protein [Candidatus Margulisbacteria bacterium]|nr:IPT/TIG domain-containing protein [Candidatus Margulisiibacteriota bacterium]